MSKEMKRAARPQDRMHLFVWCAKASTCWPASPACESVNNQTSGREPQKCVGVISSKPFSMMTGLQSRLLATNHSPTNLFTRSLTHPLLIPPPNTHPFTCFCTCVVACNPIHSLTHSSITHPKHNLTTCICTQNTYPRHKHAHVLASFTHILTHRFSPAFHLCVGTFADKHTCPFD